MSYKNLPFDNLPIEILINVYSYDSTYHDIFNNNVLPYLDFLNRVKVGSTHGWEVTPEKYICDWKYKDCITQRHNITLDKPFGVLATCSCGKKQAFNWVK